MDSIIVPAEKLPEHHALLDKVSQACAEIDTKLAMIHDVLQQENYIKRMIIIVSVAIILMLLSLSDDLHKNPRLGITNCVSEDITDESGLGTTIRVDSRYVEIDAGRDPVPRGIIQSEDSRIDGCVPEYGITTWA